MKKTFLITAFSLLIFSLSFAQDEGLSPTSKGSFLIEINTGFGETSTANTSIIIRSGGDTGRPEWAAGEEVGYFIKNNFALKAGLGYSDIGGDDNVAGEFHWKLGAKYYIAGKFPVQLNVNGLNRKYGDDPVTLNDYPLWLGIQAAYTWMIADNVSIEPGLRFAKGLNVDADNNASVFGMNIGFNIFF